MIALLLATLRQPRTWFALAAVLLVASLAHYTPFTTGELFVLASVGLLTARSFFTMCDEYWKLIRKENFNA
jgi:hypothetical protein